MDIEIKKVWYSKKILCKSQIEICIGIFSLLFMIINTELIEIEMK